MDLGSVRHIVNDNPQGVIIRMIDGTEYRLPHRDYITLGSPPAERSPRSAHKTSFVIELDDGWHLVNALLVKEIVPLPPNGKNGRSGGKPNGKKH
ncbi:MAG: hypothetical protein ACKVZJ_05820 [Phycisphaerales bacterium]